MKRRPLEPSRYSGEVPPELRIGKCIEVWADDGRDSYSAWRRFSDARRTWRDQHGLSTAEECRLLRVGGAPWSVEFLIESGRREDADERLSQAGVTLSDIPALRTAAQAHWLPD